MPAVGDVLMKRDSLAIRELIGSRVMTVLPECGRFFDDMDTLEIGSAGGEEFQIGRDGLIKKRYMGSLTGVIRSGAIFGHRALYGDGTAALGSAPFYLHNMATVGPDPKLSPVPKAWGLSMELYSYEFTVPITIGQLSLEATPAVIKDQIAPIFDGLAKNMGLYVGVHWFTKREQNFRLATASSSPTLDNTAKTITFATSEQVTMRFAPGQELDAYTSGGTRVNERSGVRIPIWVSAVRHMTNEVVVQVEPSENLAAAPWTSTISYFTWAEQLDGTGLKGPYGWSDWIKTGGASTVEKRLLGSAAITTTTDDYIDVTERPAFQSYIRSSVGTLTEQDLTLYLDEGALALSAWGYEIDTIIMSRGVRHAMWQQDLAMSYFTNRRPGTQTDYGLKGGFQIAIPSGQTLRAYVSPLLESGEVLGLKLRGNWKVITPPSSPRGAGSGGEAGRQEGVARKVQVYFKGRLWGYPSDKVPVFSGDARHMDGVHFPGVARYNMVPAAQIPGLRLTGVTVSRAFSSPS